MAGSGYGLPRLKCGEPDSESVRGATGVGSTEVSVPPVTVMVGCPWQGRGGCASWWCGRGRQVRPGRVRGRIACQGGEQRRQADQDQVRDRWRDGRRRGGHRRARRRQSVSGYEPSGPIPHHRLATWAPVGGRNRRGAVKTAPLGAFATT